MSDPVTPDALVERLRAQADTKDLCKTCRGEWRRPPNALMNEPEWVCAACKGGDPDGPVPTPRPLLRTAAAYIEALERENGVLTVDRDTYRDMTHGLTDRIEALTDELNAERTKTNDEIDMRAQERASFYAECANTPLMSQVMKQRDEAVALLREMLPDRWSSADPVPCESSRSSPVRRTKDE